MSKLEENVKRMDGRIQACDRWVQNTDNLMKKTVRQTEDLNMQVRDNLRETIRQVTETCKVNTDDMLDLRKRQDKLDKMNPHFKAMQASIEDLKSSQNEIRLHGQVLTYSLPMLNLLSIAEGLHSITDDKEKVLEFERKKVKEIFEWRENCKGGTLIE